MSGLGPLLGPMLAVLGRSWALCWRSWAVLGPMLAVLGRSWALCWRSWAALGLYVGGLGPLLGPMLAVLDRSWALCWRSWAALGAYVAEKCEEHGDLENVLISRAGAVLGRSWTLCWRSWAAPGAYVAGLGPLLGGPQPLRTPRILKKNTGTPLNTHLHTSKFWHCPS